MAYLGKTRSPRGGRPETNLAYQKKVFEFMIVNGLEGKPTEVMTLLKDWVKDKEGSLQNLPSYTTVHRLMKRFQKTPLMNLELLRPFHYPGDMRYVGWDYGRVPLECLRYYSKRFGVRPPVGLVHWFCRMAEARESDLGDANNFETEAGQIGLYAEICWFSDLVEALGKPPPDLTALELRLSWKSWRNDGDAPGYRSDAQEKGLDPDGPLLDQHRPYWLLLTDMPTFMDSSSQAEEKTETREVYLQEEDFSWYTKNILRKFPDAR